LQVPDSYLAPYDQLKGPRRQLAGMLSAVDEGIGQVVTALEQAGLRENTLLVFSADNGGPPPGSNQPLRGFKGGLYEGGVRGAAFANWRGKISAGQRISQPMHVIDWYPTLLRLAGAPADASREIDGKDVWPMLTQQAPSPHEFILSAKSPEQAALRMGDWKLIRHAAAPPIDGQGKGRGRRRQAKTTSDSWELYNLADDLAEATNLVDQETERTAAMKAKLEQLLSGAVPSGAPVADNQQ
jgi:arylsulfatase A-like enzyme